MNRIGIPWMASLSLLASLSGCQDDTEYFCVVEGSAEERGCFICRDDDCVEQPGPNRPICEASVDCAVGERCTDLGCVQECRSPDDCPLGTTCLSGLCLNPREPRPPDDPDPAPNPSPDPDPGPGPGPGIDACQFNFECAESRICIDGQCLATCLDRPCPENQDCRDGACRPCLDDACLTNCADDTDCAEGEYCSGFQCLPDTRPSTFCPENDCQPGRVCRRGQCRTPCETDDQCARIDATIRFCASVQGENLCVRSSEVLAECQLNIDCGLGDECVDGACVAMSTSP